LKHILFYVLTLGGSVAGLVLKFRTDGMLRGTVYDVVLVAVLASTTFSVRNQQLVTSTAAAVAPSLRRRSQVAINRSSVAAWLVIACAAELIQGLLKLATGDNVLGTFDPLDLACYVAGSLLSYLNNRLLLVDTP
jgi:hypothetical protein